MEKVTAIIATIITGAETGTVYHTGVRSHGLMCYTGHVTHGHDLTCLIRAATLHYTLQGVYVKAIIFCS